MHMDIHAHWFYVTARPLTILTHCAMPRITSCCMKFLSYSLSIQHKYNELVSKLCNALKVTEITYQMRCPMSKMLTYSAKEQQGRLPKYSEKILDVSRLSVSANAISSSR